MKKKVELRGAHPITLLRSETALRSNRTICCLCSLYLPLSLLKEGYSSVQIFFIIFCFYCWMRIPKPTVGTLDPPFQSIPIFFYLTLLLCTESPNFSMTIELDSGYSLFTFPAKELSKTRISVESRMQYCCVLFLSLCVLRINTLASLNTPLEHNDHCKMYYSSSAIWTKDCGSDSDSATELITVGCVRDRAWRK